MKNNQLALIVLLGLIIIGAITNPPYDDHKREISKIVSGDISFNSDNPFEALGHSLGKNLVGGLLDNLISVNNFIIFSIGTIEYQGIKKNITLGTFGNVIELSSFTKSSSKSYNPNADYKIVEKNKLDEDTYKILENKITEKLPKRERKFLKKNTILETKSLRLKERKGGGNNRIFYLTNIGNRHINRVRMNLKFMNDGVVALERKMDFIAIPVGSTDSDEASLSTKYNSIEAEVLKIEY